MMSALDTRPSGMTSFQQIRTEYEVGKYLQLVTSDDADARLDSSVLEESLKSRVELVILRLAVRGAFLVLTEGEHVYLVAGGYRVSHDNPLSAVEFVTGGGPWVRNADKDFSTWLRLFQQTTAIDASTGPVGQRVFNASNLALNEQFSGSSTEPSSPKLSFFAGTPLVSSSGQNVGVIFAVDSARKSELSTPEADWLFTAAQMTSKLFDLAQEHSFNSRWKVMQKQLNIFISSRSFRAKMLEEPQTIADRKRSASSNESESQRPNSAGTAEESLDGPDKVEGEESKRVALAQVERDRLITQRDDALNVPMLNASTGREKDSPPEESETIYRRVFRRAAQCLQHALNAEGVLFADGLLGFHGDVQPVAEPALELEKELAQPSWNKADHPSKDSHSQPGHKYQPRANTKTYTSAEYRKGVYIQRPTEVLGLSGNPSQLSLVNVSESILGLPDIDEGFFEEMMSRYPDGVVWYITDTAFMQVRDGALVGTSTQDEDRRLRSAFPGARQLIFKPVTDPVSSKRLGACFVWRSQTNPLFSEASDLASLTTFLHEVESEVARNDTAAMVNQKETFVTSVSHEMRTPLHGILGAVQLLDLSDLDPLQQSLAEIITSCGSTLHETLTSVLSYAKINQLERRQNAYSYRHPADPMSDIRQTGSKYDQDFEGLYICTNFAMLCEEIVGVLEAGRSFHGPANGEPIVVCDIEYQENWSFYTEPGSLRRIAVNLIGNALRYTEKGSVIVTLAVSDLLNDNEDSLDSTFGRSLNLKIKDTGRGMSKSFMDNHLFTPFTQEDATSSSGVGLGMSIVKSLVSLLSGEIHVRSQVNSGTEMDVRLPARKCDNQGDDRGSAVREFEHNTETLRARHLSVVIFGFPDFVRRSLEGYLRTWYGCTLLDVTDNAKPDIVLVDEGNKEVLEAVERTADAYGLHGVLLSIVMVPSKMGQEMQTIRGYKKWKRIPRPLGPGNVAKGLLGCLPKLDELRRHGIAADSDTQQDASEVEEKTKELLSGETASASDKLPTWALGKLQLSDKPDVPTPNSTPTPAPSTASHLVKQNSLPAAPVRSQKANSKEADRKENPGISLLLVDDNSMNLKLLGTFFKKNGYSDCEEAKDGAEALAIVQQRSTAFEIIFMDLSMPIMDGFEATRQIRRLENERASALTKPATIIALTGLASNSDQKKAFDAGVDLFFTKPVQFSKLSTLLQEYKDGTLKSERLTGKR